MYLILWLSLQFEPVQETNLFLLTLATFTVTVQKGLKAFPLYDCKTWTLVDKKTKKKKKEITAYDFIQSCDIE